MNHEVTIFQFNQNDVRIFINNQGVPEWVAKDVCGILGYANSRDTVSKFCRGAGVANRDIRSGGQQRKLTCIDEGNLYRLIIKSNKPESEAFEAWVCDEVLPTIRKTGLMPCHQPRVILPRRCYMGSNRSWTG